MIQQPELGKKIADLRKEKGLTQEELVEKCNLNVRTLQRIESGEATPRTYTLRLIFEALEYSLDEPIENKGLNLKWHEQFYISFIDLFNLKTNTMRKVTILTIAVSGIILGLFTLGFKSEAQTKPIDVQNEIDLKTTADKQTGENYFTCESSFQENDDIIGYGVKLKKNGVTVNVQLIKLNINNGNFNVGFVKGNFQSKKVEAFSPKAWIDKGDLTFEAKDSIVYNEANSEIILYGKAKLTSIKNEYIEANKIVLHLE